jgi:hypothetical protein
MGEGDNRAADQQKHDYDCRNYDDAFAALFAPVSVTVHIRLLQNS